MRTQTSSRSRLPRIGLILLVFLLVLAAIFLLGPRVPVDTGVRPVDLPADLDAYLAAGEVRFDDIVPGTEKRIVWAGQPGQQTDWAVVHLHSFSATRQETAPLAEDLAATPGANLYEARLPMMGLVKLVRDLDFSAVDVPALIIYSPRDEVVNPQRTEQVFQQWGATRKQLLPIEGSDDARNHVLAGDILSPSTTGVVKDAILRFLEAEAAR